MNLYYHHGGDDWSLRSYHSFGLQESLDDAMKAIEDWTWSHTGYFFLLAPNCYPFWQSDKSGLGCTVNVDNEYCARPVGGKRNECSPYIPCVRRKVEDPRVYSVGVSLTLVKKEVHVIWRERSHDW